MNFELQTLTLTQAATQNADALVVVISGSSVILFSHDGAVGRLPLAKRSFGLDLLSQAS